MTIPIPAPIPAHLSTPELARELRLDRSPSTLVRIDTDALEAIVEHIRKREDFCAYERYRWDDPKFWYPEGTPEERSQYFAVGNAINFRFWRLVSGEVVPAGGLLDGQRLTGAMYMWRCLRRRLDDRRLPIFQASFLADITEEQFDEIFADDAGINPLATAREDRLANLRDLGNKLKRDWDGNFFNVIQATQGSLVEFVGLSGRFRAFDDPLLKLTMVNTILHLGSGIIEFDADPLPGIDYHLLKQLLRQGVLVPHRTIAEKLEQKVLLSVAEGYELRRAALNAFVHISARTGLSGEILDNKWWWNRLKCRTENPVCLDPQTAHDCPFFGPCAQHTELGMPLEETRYY
jgi:putative queuosine salvage protein